MVTYVLPLDMVELKIYSPKGKKSFFDAWFDSLDPMAAARATTALTRLKLGHKKNLKSLGGGVYEIKIDFGPGYRIYFGWQNKEVVLLLCGGDKKTQKTDVKRAKELWAEYKKAA